MSNPRMIPESMDDPRDSKFHKKIVSVKKIPDTRAGNYLQLECGHQAMSFGDVSRAEGRVLCMFCLSEHERKVAESN